MSSAILVLLLVASTASGSATPPAAGISHDLAKQRAAQLSEVRYALDMDVRGRDTAFGRARIAFRRRGTSDLILDFRGPSFGDVRVNGAPATVAAVNGHLVIPARYLVAGANEIAMTFSAMMAPAGASVIRFHDVADGADYLYTLLVPSDANQLFPCFDQPDLKARVTLTLATPARWTAVANGALAGVDSTGTSSGLTFRFAASDPISTYLVAFAAGPWTVRSASVRGRPVSMFVRASRAREAETDTLIALNVAALEWMERYTSRAFPFQKLDFVLAPAFPFGGMEHPGAVFYSEDAFIFRERPTLSQRLGRQATIFHEIAHQWFGDFTTMRWFDDLWLKEGFATYLAAVMQDDLSRDAGAWKTFYLRNKPAAYAVDASAGTTPVWQALANLDQAKSNYGAIVYNKAPGILKQLNHLVGDTAFRDGLRHYLSAHPYGNATWQDLLASIGGTAHRSLDDWGARYIRRPGMPVLTQRLTIRNGAIARLTIEQAPARALSGTAPWPARVQVLLGRAGAPAEMVNVELRGRATEVPVRGRPAPDFVFANAGDFGYALVQLDARSLAWLETGIGTVRDDFLRAMLWGALWDDVRAARMSPVRFIRAALRELPGERDEEIVPVLLGRVSRSAGSYLSIADHNALAPEIERAFWAGASDTSRSYGVRKSHLDAYISVARTPAAIVRLDALLDSAVVAGAPLRAPTRWSLVTALVAHGAASAERRLADEVRRDSTNEGRRGAFVAGAARADAPNKADYFRRWLDDRALNEDWATSSLRAFHDPGQDSLTAPYLLRALEVLPWIQRNRRIFFLGRWVQSTIEGQHSPQALARIDSFLRTTPDLPQDLREKVLQSRDELERTVAIRRAFP